LSDILLAQIVEVAAGASTSRGFSKKFSSFLEYAPTELFAEFTTDYQLRWQNNWAINAWPDADSISVAHPL